MFQLYFLRILNFRPHFQARSKPRNRNVSKASDFTGYHSARLQAGACSTLRCPFEGGRYIPQTAFSRRLPQSLSGHKYWT